MKGNKKFLCKVNYYFKMRYIDLGYRISGISILKGNIYIKKGYMDSKWGNKLKEEEEKKGKEFLNYSTDLIFF